MKKILLSLLMLTALNCFGNPRIQLDSTKHDFGRQARNSELKHIFTFKNVGTGTLVIEKVTAG